MRRCREALAREQGNVSRAARALGMYRTQLRRWLAVHGLSGSTGSDDSDRAPPIGD